MPSSHPQLPADLLEILAAKPSLNLFPTENRMSKRALAALGRDAVHRYPSAEGPDFFYGDTLGLAALYEHCEDLARRFFGVRHAFVNLLSGLNTLHAVLASLCDPGDRIFIMDPSCGGHYATGPICEGYRFDYEHLPFNRETCLIDVGGVARMARSKPPRMVYLDLSTLVRLPPMAQIRDAVGPEPLICLDASHILGLLPSAPEGTGLRAGGSTCSGSTHKTFPGPQKGVFLTDDDAIAERFRSRLPFIVSSSHSNSIGALAITLEELMEDRVRYGLAVRENARALARELASKGFDVPGEAFGFTETHQVWIVAPPGTSAIEWGKRLRAASIRATAVTLPSNGIPGLRLGVQELTRMGMGGAEMARVAEILTGCLLRGEPVERIEAAVGELDRSFITPHFIREPFAEVNTSPRHS